MIVDGKKIAEEILQELEKERASLPLVLRLGVVMGAGDAASDSFVRIKERTAKRLRVDVSREVLAKDSSTTDAIHAVLRLSKATAGVIIQMPIPNADEMVAALQPERDVDGLGQNAIVLPPVAGAVLKILQHANLLNEAKLHADTRAVVVGAGKLVGAPAAVLLRDLGADVEVVTKHDGRLILLKNADIVVLGAGEPGLITPDMIKQGTVLIDAGTSEAVGKLAGDADPACANVASVFTPVPGGVGPITVAMLFKNLFALAQGPTI
ncbi:bifunctional 5,10-methylenetetrahydrofolate dehydrogenase/5,10-methenyltetrahydrofolate cyclohydrolase [Patescibacteria group bacterium]|nr:bifunctional 5,10-methylenetetrahydrofolate dehydrogenase/5,10-methenyltetrahydrofolate cyclohydrolase [Patescibacteria group bacterium]